MISEADSARAISFVIPVHNEAGIIRSVPEIIGRWKLESYFSNITVILVENGSSDTSKQEVLKVVSDSSVASDCSKIAQPIRLLGFLEDNAGIGYAYSRGITEAINNYPASTNHWIVLSACDLPFADSDLRSFLRYLKLYPDRCVFIGSKAHPESQVTRGLPRSLIAFAFKLARSLLLGLNIGDTQGSFFLRSDFAVKILPQIQARDFSFTTELCFLATRLKQKIVELPVVLVPEVRPSTVRPIRDSIKVLKVLVRLWRSGR